MDGNPKHNASVTPIGGGGGIKHESIPARETIQRVDQHSAGVADRYAVTNSRRTQSNFITSGQRRPTSDKSALTGDDVISAAAGRQGASCGSHDAAPLNSAAADSTATLRPDELLLNEYDLEMGPAMYMKLVDQRRMFCRPYRVSRKK